MLIFFLLTSKSFFGWARSKILMSRRDAVEAVMGIAEEKALLELLEAVAKLRVSSCAMSQVKTITVNTSVQVSGVDDA